MSDGYELLASHYDALQQAVDYPAWARFILELDQRHSLRTGAGDGFDGRPLLLDLGCGTGRLLEGLSRRRPDLILHGVESAWLPWLWARLRLARRPNVSVTLGDIWPASLAGYGVIYTYLSPEPMARIWHKVKQEADSGAWLISNSFAVPDVQPDESIAVDDATASTLYIWRLTT